MRYFRNLKIFLLSLSFILSFTLPTGNIFAKSPNLFFSTPPKQIAEGERVSLEVRVQSSDQAINAISGSISFPEALVKAVSVSKENSIINLWTVEPKVQRNKVVFEGIVLNPGFQGSSGSVFKVTFEARKTGTVLVNMSEGAVLANDGLGTNILTVLGSAGFNIVPGKVFASGDSVIANGRLAALPVITEYSAQIESKNELYVKGKGEPQALTKIVFKDVSIKSLGEKLIAMLQTKKKKLDEVLVKNDSSGLFEYISPKNLVAGVYNATPFLVDNNTNTEKPGFGAQLLVNDSKIVKNLVILLNVLGLLIPIVGLCVIIYFIPWYSWRKMRVLKKKLGLEEEKIDISGHQLERQDKILDKSVNDIVNSEKP